MSVGDLDELYQELILHHSRSPRNFGVVEGANRLAEGYNPLCGDRCHLTARVEDGRITDLRFTGQGCAISTASASVMTDELKGRSLDETQSAIQGFQRLVTGAAAAPESASKLAAFAGVHKFPMRVKCAMLAWRTLEAALEQEARPVTTE